MTAQFNLPAPDAPAEEWGRLAVSLPGWRWMAGTVAMGCGRVLRAYADGSCAITRHKILPDEMDIYLPDPDDPGTEGCFLRLLGNCAGFVAYSRNRAGWLDTFHGWSSASLYPTLGRACVAHAARRARWPGGAS
jgi:hypothetical protein